MQNTCSRITCVKFMVLIVVLSRHPYLKSCSKHSTLKTTASLRNKIKIFPLKKKKKKLANTLQYFETDPSLFKPSSPAFPHPLFLSGNKTQEEKERESQKVTAGL